jgi:hypothetical protein
MAQLLAFIAAGRSFGPFFGRRLPGLVASANLAEARHAAVACHRKGGSPAAEMLARSLDRTRDQARRHDALDISEFQAVLVTLRDPSFTFVDALSVAAWGRIAGLRCRVTASPPGFPHWLRPGACRTHLADRWRWKAQFWRISRFTAIVLNTQENPVVQAGLGQHR